MSVYTVFSSLAFLAHICHHLLLGSNMGSENWFKCYLVYLLNNRFSSQLVKKNFMVENVVVILLPTTWTSAIYKCVQVTPTMLHYLNT